MYKVDKYSVQFFTSSKQQFSLSSDENMNLENEKGINLIAVPRKHAKSSQIKFNNNFLTRYWRYAILLSILLGSYLVIITVNHQLKQLNHKSVQLNISLLTKSVKSETRNSKSNKCNEPLIEVTTQIPTKK